MWISIHDKQSNPNLFHLVLGNAEHARTALTVPGPAFGVYMLFTG